MRLELKEFAKAARSMHQQPGGVKRTRLMLHLRPYKTRKVFVLKATDGRTRLTTRVEHQGQIKLVEALMSDFVAECTRLSVPPPPAAAAAAANDIGQSQPSFPAGAAQASSQPAGSPSAAQKDGAGGKSSSSGGGASNQSAAHQQQQQQQQQQKAGKASNKGKKGKKH